MIKLEFSDVDESTFLRVLDSVRANNNHIVRLDGGISFIVNDVEFRNYLDLVDFARQLNKISQELKAGRDPYPLGECGSPWTLTFSRMGNTQVLIEQGIDGRPTEILSAEEIVQERSPGILSAVADIDELQAAASKFLYEVFAHCCTLFPPLTQDRNTKQYLGILDGQRS